MLRHLIYITIFIFLLNSLHAQTSPKPNIIFIFADDLGYGDIGCYGQKKIKTPNIDLLAKQGLKFTNFYAGSTVCAPSRASLMTGLHTGHTPVRGNKGFEPEGQAPLPDSVVTIATLLQQNGYATGAFGKWGMGFITTTGDPNKKGFDQFFGYNCQSLAHNYYPDHLWNNHERIDLKSVPGKDSVYSADLIHQNALKFLAQAHTKPFFAYLPYTLPHGDVIVPHDSLYQHYIKKFNEQPLKARPANYSNKNRPFEPYPHAAFAAMVARLDRYVGEIVKTIREKGLDGNTLILFSSDNGPHRENGGDPEFFESNGGLRGIKRDLYEGGIRVPFIAYWKGKIKAGTTERVAALWDLHPTFTELAGVKTSKRVDGISLVPTFNNKKNRDHEHLYWEFHEQNGRQAVRWKNWKGVKLNVNKDLNAPVELYNLETDPTEKNNVAANHPDILAKLTAIIKSEHVFNKDWPLLASEK